MKPIDQKIYLASKSPRRRELLRQIGVEFELLLLRENTARGPGRERGTCCRRSGERLRRARDPRKGRIRRATHAVAQAADATGADGRHHGHASMASILGKPATMPRRLDMLRGCPARTHQVLTSVAYASTDEIWQTTQHSEVTFAQP